jgi:ABC-type sugar transport system ATPase subunit
MDEPTSALDEAEVEALFRRVRALRDRGCAILFVTHRMDEIYALADRITVLRDGVVAATGGPKDLDRDALVAAMLGRELRAAMEEESTRDRVRSAERLLEVRGLCIDHPTRRARVEVRDATFAVDSGEIVGLAGVAGSGVRTLLHGVFGSASHKPRGEVVVARTPLPLGDPAASVARGLAFVPADRKSQGLVFARSVRENAALSALRRWTALGIVRSAEERREVASMMRSLHVVGALESPVEALSGGNQQKVVLGRCLLARPKVLLLDEPTRGIDVGAKAEIHRRLRALADEGVGILVATTEIDDLLALCDRVLVMHRGSIVASFPRAEASRDRVLRAAMGHFDD